MRECFSPPMKSERFEPLYENRISRGCFATNTPGMIQDILARWIESGVRNQNTRSESCCRSSRFAGPETFEMERIRESVPWTSVGSQTMRTANCPVVRKSSTRFETALREVSHESFSNTAPYESINSGALPAQERPGRK